MYILSLVMKRSISMRYFHTGAVNKAKQSKNFNVDFEIQNSSRIGLTTLGDDFSSSVVPKNFCQNLLCKVVAPVNSQFIYIHTANCSYPFRASRPGFLRQFQPLILNLSPNRYQVDASC